MTTRGIYGIITDGKERRDPCLIIGASIPRVHHSDGIPVFLVVDHPQGWPVQINDGTKAGRIRRLLAYPSAWPGPGEENPGLWIYAYVEPMPFNTLVPLFNLEAPGGTLATTESITEACHRLAVPPPSKL